MSKSPVRYRTAGGAIVTITQLKRDKFATSCEGCTWSSWALLDHLAEEKAQKHADKCKALPR